MTFAYRAVPVGLIAAAMLMRVHRGRCVGHLVKPLNVSPRSVTALSPLAVAPTLIVHQATPVWTAPAKPVVKRKTIAQRSGGALIDCVIRLRTVKRTLSARRERFVWAVGAYPDARKTLVVHSVKPAKTDDANKAATITPTARSIEPAKRVSAWMKCVWVMIVH